jgi:imidazolonepropionase-like amidohydrolase
MEALEAGTRIASEVLGLESQIGTIEVGKLADLVVVQGNPLDDVGMLVSEEAVPLVMQGGKLVKEKFH